VTLRLLAGVAALALLDSAGPAATTPQSGATHPRAEYAARVRPAPPDVDLLKIRNIFRYGDEPGVESLPVEEYDASEPTPSGSPHLPPSRVRIVGLVSRAGAPVAALAIDGEVVLLGEGEGALGFTVLGIRDEAIRLRDPEGDETTLPLP
jgi:hypothetical protein